jgi:hypothetical protein
MTDFPWRRYTNEELQTEYKKLLDFTLKSPDAVELKRSIMGYRCSNYFFQHERMNTSTRGNKTPLEYWNENKKSCIKRKDKDISHDLFGIVQHLSDYPEKNAGFVFIFQPICMIKSVRL